MSADLKFFCTCQRCGSTFERRIKIQKPCPRCCGSKFIVVPAAQGKPA